MPGLLWNNLLEAIQLDDSHRVQSLLDATPDLVNQKTGNYFRLPAPAPMLGIWAGSWTFLHFAADIGKEDVIRVLLIVMSLEDISTVNLRGDTALHLAATGGYEKTVEMLLPRMSPDSIAAYDGNHKTALHLASNLGHDKVVEMLLPKMSQESIAACDGNQNLVGRGDREDFRVISPVNRKGKTALYLATRSGYEKVVELLLPRMSSETISAVNSIDQTILHLAASGGYEKVVELLLFRMSTKSIDAVDNLHQTALHLANRGGYKKVMEMLIPRMSPEAIYSVATDEQLETGNLFKVIMEIYLRARQSEVRGLLESEKSLNVEREKQLMAEQVAKQQSAEELQKLEKLSLESLEVKESEWDKLVKAILVNDMQQVESLLEGTPALINEKDDRGWTALHYTVEYHNNHKPGIVEVLLQKMSPESINAVADAGNTALDLIMDNKKYIITLFNKAAGRQLYVIDDITPAPLSAKQEVFGLEMQPLIVLENALEANLAGASNTPHENCCCTIS